MEWKLIIKKRKREELPMWQAFVLESNLDSKAAC